jgi:hypothetical protein
MRSDHHGEVIQAVDTGEEHLVRVAAAKRERQAAINRTVAASPPDWLRSTRPSSA